MTPHRSTRLLLWIRHIRKRTASVARPIVWVLAGIVGLATGYAVIGFTMAIENISGFAYGVSTDSLASGARGLSNLRVLLIPIIGGVLVGTLLYAGRKLGILAESRCRGVADVIEARAAPPGNISLRTGLFNTLATMLSLGSGASSGREGPVVFLGGTIATVFAQKFGLRATDTRILIGCGAAAAVAAGFNAPIAGVLFALEVVLGNYALSVFGPVALASLVGAIVGRLHLGDVHSFIIPAYDSGGAYTIPLAAILGLICGVVAFAFLQGLAYTQTWLKQKTTRYHIDPALLPLAAGMFIGVTALAFPEILGVGYEATMEAIKGNYTLGLLTVLLVVKIISTIICLSCGFGTGVFSGGIYFGAMSGAAFGLLAAQYLPGLSADSTFYAVIGMGAVSGAILGAPISTTLIVFELTGDYEMTVALMVAVGIATQFTQVVFGSSWFHWQLNQRGYDLSEGPQGVILQTIRVRDVMRKVLPDSPTVEEGAPHLLPTQSLGQAIAQLTYRDLDGMPVVDLDDRTKRIGYVSRVRALDVYNRALIENNIEHAQ